MTNFLNYGEQKPTHPPTHFRHSAEERTLFPDLHDCWLRSSNASGNPNLGGYTNSSESFRIAPRTGFLSISNSMCESLIGIRVCPFADSVVASERLLGLHRRL
jgi:hypothetical protein